MASSKSEARRPRRILVIFILILLFVTLILGVNRKLNPFLARTDERSILRVKNLDGAGVQVRSCSIHKCFEIVLCSLSVRDRIGVYVYDEMTFVDSHGSALNIPYSMEYRQLLQAVKSSPYYQTNFSKACLFIPPIDTLSQLRINTSDVSRILSSIPGYVYIVRYMVLKVLVCLQLGRWVKSFDS